jgi:hypothetical protein
MRSTLQKFFLFVGIVFAIIFVILVVPLLWIIISVNTTHGQTPSITSCDPATLIYHDDKLVIIHLSESFNIECMAYYTAQGFEIKAILGTAPNLEIYMQKLN